VAFLYLLISLLLIFGIVGAVVYFFTDMTSRVKYLVIASLLFGWLLIAGYSYYQNKKRIYHDMLYYNFTHGKELVCQAPFNQQVVVNNRYFDFVSGTMVFMGKEGSPYEGLVVPIDGCRLKK